MKNAFFLLFVLFSLLSYSQSESDIAYIRAFVEKVNADSKDYQTAIIDTEQAETTEGNEVVVYTKELNDIKLIKETYYGEMGKTVILNYIDNNQAIFIYKQYIAYKYPITYKEFNANDFTKTEERFYLKNGRVIRWMKDKKVLKTYPLNAAAIENNMVEHIAALIAKFQKENKE